MGWYREYFVDTGRSAALWVLIGYLVTVVITRVVTRRIRAARTEPDKVAKTDAKPSGLSDVYIMGVHVHHQVWGIFLILTTGLFEFRYNPDQPWSEVLAALFGVGAALTLDEFALWFHLDDVYWGEEGRKSIDALLIGGTIGLILLMQAEPFGAKSEAGLVANLLYIFEILLHLSTAAVCIVKGKLATGLIGVIVPIVAMVGLLRLAKPNSVWARRRYNDKKLARARSRFGPAYQRRQDWIRDLVGGRPDQPETSPRPGD